MSSYDSLPIYFHINSTNSYLNCTSFDKLNYDYLATYTTSRGENPTLPSGYSYSCSAYPPGSTKDVALHYQPPKPPAWNELSETEKQGVIIASVIVGLLIAWVLFWWWRKKHPKPPSEDRVRQNEDGLDLGDLSGGVVRAEEDGVHRPPQYRRVAKPHEVPPGYGVTLNQVSSSVMDGPDLGAPPTYQRRRKSRWNIFQTRGRE